MSEIILNKVTNSVLVNFDLESYIPKGSRTFIDISQWLEQGFLLREKPFREALITHDWKKYSRHHIALGCSTGAVLPAWASLLVTSYLQPVAKIIVLGDLMIDQYLWGSCDRISPEAPVQVVKIKDESMTLGGAGNVISNLNALGSIVDVISIIGNCEISKELKDMYKNFLKSQMSYQ